MFFQILDLLLGTGFRKAGMGKQYRVARKTVRYVNKKINEPPSRRQIQYAKTQKVSPNVEGKTASLPITDHQIKIFKNLQNKVKKLENNDIGKIEYLVPQKKRRDQDRRTFEIAEVSTPFIKIDPKHLERGDFQLIRKEIVKKFESQKKVETERKNNFKKYGKAETNRERTLRLNERQRKDNLRKYGISETNAERDKRLKK